MKEIIDFLTTQIPVNMWFLVLVGLAAILWIIAFPIYTITLRKKNKTIRVYMELYQTYNRKTIEYLHENFTLREGVEHLKKEKSALEDELTRRDKIYTGNQKFLQEKLKEATNSNRRFAIESALEFNRADQVGDNFEKQYRGIYNFLKGK